MRCTLIGTGNVATNLLPALEEAGHQVKQLHGRSFGICDVTGEVVIVCVKDSALSYVMQRLSNCPQLVVHTAGSMGVETVPAKHRGVLYPLQTLSKQRIISLKEVPMFVESDTDIELLEQLAHSLSHRVYRATSLQRRQLHLAAVFACNFTNHCYTLAHGLLKQSGLPFEVLLPLIDETANKVHQLPPQLSQTGPAVRWDENVITRHLDMLDGYTREIYELMSKSIHDKL